MELTFSQMLEDNEKFRIDSEFFQKHFLHTYKIIKSKPNKQMIEIVDVLTDFSANGSYKSIANNFKLLDYNSYAYMVRTTDLESSNYTQDVKYIDEASYNFLGKSKIYGGEILINKIGNPGRVYHMPKLKRPVSLGMNLFMLRISENNDFTEEYIWAYLNSKFGKMMINRKVNGSVPLTIDKIAIKTLYIPDFGKEFQTKITTAILNSQKKEESSKSLYKEAENILLKELDLLDFKPTQENIAIKSFSKSFLETGRLDSEYYQPKYDEIVERIKNYRGGCKSIESVCILKDSNHKPISDKHYQYIELSNIGTTGDITGFTYNLGKELPSRARRMVKENDVIISSIEGSLGKVAFVTEEFSDSLCSTGFYVLNSQSINPETLLVLFKNSIIQQILKQNCSGTILTGMNKDEFLNILIPIIDISIQAKIEKKIKTSFQLKSKSIELLALAKRAVEVAIEEGEEVAFELIGENYE